MSAALQVARRRARSGDDYAGLIELVPYARFLGVQLERRDGRACSRLPYRPDLVGNRVTGALHGGVTAAFMENAALLQLMLQLDVDRIPKSIDFAIDYLLPGRALDCYADCTVSRAGGRVAHTVVQCWQETPQQPIAIARAHFLLSASE